MGRDFITLAFLFYGIAMALSGWQYTRARKGTCEIVSWSQSGKSVIVAVATVPVGPGSGGGAFEFHMHEGIFGAPLVGARTHCKVFEKTGVPATLGHRPNELGKISAWSWWLIWCYGCLTFMAFCIMGAMATPDDKNGDYACTVAGWAFLLLFVMLSVIDGINHTSNCTVAAAIPAGNGTEHVMAASKNIGSGWITARAGEYVVSDSIFGCKGDGLTGKITEFNGIRTDNAPFSDSTNPLDIAINAMPLVTVAGFFIAAVLHCIRPDQPEPRYRPLNSA